MTGSMMSMNPSDYMFGADQAMSFDRAFAPYASAGNSAVSPLASMGLNPLGSLNPNLQQQLGGITANGLPKMPGAGGGGLFAGMSGLDKAQAALGGLQTIGGLWNAFQTQKLAKKQFSFAKDYAEANMANQIQSYNTALADRARSRAFVEGQPQSSADAYVASNSMTRRPN